MLKAVFVDFETVKPEHKLIHKLLENWALWVKPTAHSALCPMFRMCKSNVRQWHLPAYRPSCDILAAQETEKKMRHLSAKQRDAIKWFYLYPTISQAKVCKHLGLSRIELQGVLNDARSLLAD